MMCCSRTLITLEFFRGKKHHMSNIKGKIRAVINLSPSTCHFMRTGKCSLKVVSDYFTSTSTRTSAADLLYCPKLYRLMRGRDNRKPVVITPCECGHAEVISGHQRVCIASQTGIELAVKLTRGRHKKNCPVCGGQLTFEKNAGTNQIVGLQIKADSEG